MLESFIKQVKSGVSQVDVDSTLTSIKILIAGQISKKLKKFYRGFRIVKSIADLSNLKDGVALITGGAGHIKGNGLGSN